MEEQVNSRYPLSDAAYDIIVILYEKSKALEAYDAYLTDFQHDTHLRQALVAIRHDEQRHIETLKSHLPRLLVTPVTTDAAQEETEEVGESVEDSSSQLVDGNSELSEKDMT